MRGLNILLVDDNVNFINAFKYVLHNIECDNSIENIYTALNGEECLSIVKKEKLDLVFIDADMPEMDGAEATRQIVMHNNSIKIVALSFHKEAEYIRRMICAGAVNYLKKDELSIEVLRDELNLK